MIGSTNHLDQLDDGITKRPSRFDRKFLFPPPNFEQRVMYAQFWRRKLLGDKAASESSDVDDEDGELDLSSLQLGDSEIEFPEKLCAAIAKITDKFSFAYMQEAFVAALLVIASDNDAAHGPSGDYVVVSTMEEKLSDGDEFEGLVLWQELKKQIKTLREQLGEMM